MPRNFLSYESVMTNEAVTYRCLLYVRCFYNLSANIRMLRIVFTGIYISMYCMVAFSTYSVSCPVRSFFFCIPLRPCQDHLFRFSDGLLLQFITFFVACGIQAHFLSINVSYILPALYVFEYAGSGSGSLKFFQQELNY